MKGFFAFCICGLFSSWEVQEKGLSAIKWFVIEHLKH